MKATERLTERQRLGAKLPPALREFVDRVIVPALVREYVAEHGSGNHIANHSATVRKFPVNDRLSAGEIQ